MKKFSLFQIVLMAVFGALAVAGVLIFALAVGGGNTKALGAVTIWGTLDSNAFTAVLREAADQDSSLNQVSYVQKNAATYESDLTSALASGTGPDLFLMTQDYAVQDAGKVITIPDSSLSQSKFESTFIEAASPFETSSGVIGVPIIADPLVLYWNKDMLSSAGFSQPPAYWDQLFSMAQRLSVKDDAGSLLKSGIAFGEYQNVDHAKEVLATLILQAGGTITTRDTTGRILSTLVPKAGSSNAQATVSALRFYTEFADPSKDDYSWNRSLPEAQTAFATSRLALYVGYASEANDIAKMNPNLNFAIAPMPQIRTGDRVLDTARVYAFAIPKTAKNPSSSLIVAFVLNSAANAEALSKALGLPSARRDIVGASASGNLDLFNRMTIAAHSWLDPDPLATADIFRAMIEDTTSGASLINEAVSRADQQLNQLLTQGQDQ